MGISRSRFQFQPAVARLIPHSIPLTPGARLLRILEGVQALLRQANLEGALIAPRLVATEVLAARGRRLA